MKHSSQALYTSKFITLCVSFAFFGASFNMIIPELPSFLSGLGGAEYKGFIIALFTLTAGFSRPFSGKLADTVGRMPVIITGAVVCIMCSLMYPLLTTVSAFMFLRLCHGFSTGFTPTAITAYVADIAPVPRRGEAMGIIGVSINLGASISPPIGSFVANTYSLDAMFYFSSFIALVSVSLLMFMKETLPEPVRFRPSLLLLKSNEIIDRNSLVPALICGFTYMGLGAILTIVPDQCDHLGMSNKGLFFTSFTVCSVFSRLVAGQISDNKGRVMVIKFSLVFLGLSYILMSFVDSQMMLLAATGCIGFSMGIASPAIFAWTIDRSNDDNRGRAMATIYIGLEMAIGTGALIAASIYNNNPANFQMTFWVIGVSSILALWVVSKSKDVIVEIGEEIVL